MPVTYIGRCDHLRAEDLDEFDETSADITNRTFRKHLGKEVYLEFERGLGYVDRWLKLSMDYHVSYAKGLWKGKPAVCCFWSAFHHIWQLEDKAGADSAENHQSAISEDVPQGSSLPC